MVKSFISVMGVVLCVAAPCVFAQAPVVDINSPAVKTAVPVVKTSVVKTPVPAVKATVANTIAPAVASSAAVKLEQTAAARLLALVIDSYIPNVLYNEKNQPWMGGVRSITISKAGASVLSSDANNIVVSFPLKANLIGDINTNIVLMQLKAHCVAQFTAPAKINLAVNLNSKPISVTSRIDLTVPPVMADCDGYKLAVEGVIQSVIVQEKPKWERDIQAQISDGLMVLGL
ncbi:MAG: hypothetical protein U5M23_13840 [Marinagarivorans sp.]|nr:hypothetical protein [Marinagarivorans sp.]